MFGETIMVAKVTDGQCIVWSDYNCGEREVMTVYNIILVGVTVVANMTMDGQCNTVLWQTD